MIGTVRYKSGQWAWEYVIDNVAVAEVGCDTCDTMEKAEAYFMIAFAEGMMCRWPKFCADVAPRVMRA